MHPAYMLLPIPLFFLFMGIEWFIGYLGKKELYRLNDSVNNLVVGLGQQLWSLVFKVVLFGVYIWFYEHYSFFKIPPTWWSFVLCLLAFDFFFYWAHRWGHEMNIFWGAHSVHHQSEEYNLSVALRQSWFHSIIAFVIFLPIPMMGFDPKIFGAAAVTHTLYQFWIHTKLVGKLHPWIEYWINTPSHHRVHHAVNPKYIDKNHAGVFMIWDRMFGTFKEEEAEDEITYGITTQLKSWNPAWANVHYYVEMFQKAREMKGFDKVRMIFAKPGWMPEYLGGFRYVQEVDKSTFQKYDANTNLYFKIYAVVQFFIMLSVSLLYMLHFKEMSLFYKTVFFCLILITMLITGAIFENKRWVVYAEYARLVLVMLSLNTFYYFWYLNWFNATIILSSVLFAGCIIFFTWSYLHREPAKTLQPVSNN
ncbi:MAG: Sterol desaturase [Bacteroidota bacterium]|nr:Sterol desaturase [Bacteroidota bacterium]